MDRQTWLRPLLGAATPDGRAPRAYLLALHRVVVALDAAPAWQRWWRAAGVPACELGIVADARRVHPRPSADIARGVRALRATFTCAVPPRSADPLPTAVAEVTGMFEVIRRAIGLPPLPPVPALPPAVGGAGPAVRTRRRVRPAGRPAPGPGYLTLAEVHGFFGDADAG